MKDRQNQDSNTDEEKGAEDQRPTTAKVGLSRKGTARSDRTSKGDSPVAIKRLSEFQATHSPTEEEVGNKDQPELDVKKPSLNHHLTGVTQVNDPPEEQSEGPEAV
jgi:hypothetical protein